MEDYDPSTYGDRIARIYDRLYESAFDTDSIVDFLAPRARGGPALEFGIGTGRIALPLARRGIEVAGIDTSEEMVARLRDKPGGDDVEVVMGDFSEAGVERTFRLVYLIFNTIFGLLTQDAQIRCFANAARHLDDDGVFVIEAFVPDLARFDRGQRVSADKVSMDEVQLEASRHEPAHQRVDSQHLFVTEKGVEMFPVAIRYAYPAELDLMARLTGLRLRERHGGWREEPFTSSSQQHVSVYERDHLPSGPVTG